MPTPNDNNTKYNRNPIQCAIFIVVIIVECINVMLGKQWQFVFFYMMTAAMWRATAKTTTTTIPTPHLIFQLLPQYNGCRVEWNESFSPYEEHPVHRHTVYSICLCSRWLDSRRRRIASYGDKDGWNLYDIRFHRCFVSQANGNSCTRNRECQRR